MRGGHEWLRSGGRAVGGPMEFRVKVCGITNPEDARIAAEAGADAIGINFFPGSKRFVTLDAVAPWLRDVAVARVAVVVNATADEVLRLAESGVIDALQFHGDESAEFCADLGRRTGLPWLRAARVRGQDDLVSALDYDTPWLLLDGFSPTEYGGTGHAVDRALAVDFVAGHPERSVVLAGGLRAENVREAVAAVRPAGVDVASGVERPGDPRRKDADSVGQFIAEARAGAP